MHIPTEYEIYINKYNIVDGDTFLSNLEKIAKSDENAKLLQEKLEKMKNSKIDIPKDLSKEHLLTEIDKYYNCANSLTISGLYHIILTHFQYKINENACTINLEPVKEDLYKAYKQDYNKFISCIHTYIQNPTEWGIKSFIRDSVDIKNNTNGLNKKLPKIPYIPFG